MTDRALSDLTQATAGVLSDLDTGALVYTVVGGNSRFAQIGPLPNGPSTSTDNVAVRFDGTSGDIQGTGITISDADVVSGATINSNANTLTLDLGEGTLTGSVTEFNTALQSASFGTFAAAQTDNAIVRADGTGGLLQTSSVIINDAGDVDISGSLTLDDATTLLWLQADTAPDAAFVRITENTSYQGGYFGYDSSANVVYLGGHDTQDVLTASDVAVLSWPRGGASVSALVQLNVLGSSGLQVGSSVPFADSSGTLTLQNVDALDATTESTIEAAIDTLANLTSAASLATVGTVTSGVWNSTFGATANEAIQDLVGAMTTGNTETLISVTYQDADGTIDFVVDEAGIDHGSIAGLADDDHTQYSIISSGAGAPASTPSRVGALYVDTTGDLAYVATDALSSADWDRLLVAGDIGANVQAYDADLASWAAITRAANFDTFVATPSSANLAAAVTDETGSGALVFGTSPTIATPTLTLEDAAGAAPTTDGQIKYDRTGENLEVGTGAATVTFSNDTTLAATYQPLAANLTTWAGLAPSANAQSLVTAANYAAMRTLLDLEAGTDFYSIAAADAAFQPLDSDLTSIAALTTTAAGRSVLTVADPGADRVMAWDDTAGTISAIALADLTTEASPATGDYMLVYGAEGDLRKVDWSSLPGAGGGNAWSDPVNSDILPTGATNTYDLGSSSAYFAEGWVHDLYVGTQFVGGHTSLLGFDAGGGSAFTPDWQIHGTSDATAGFGLGRWDNSSNPAYLGLGKSRGGIGTQTVVQDNDQLGYIYFDGSDGTNMIEAAAIFARVNGTPGTADMPGELVFATTADGASAPTERMRIEQDGGTTIVGFLTVLDGNIPNLSVGGDDNASTRTNSAAKQSTISVPHFTSDTEEEVCMLYADMGSSFNSLSFGGRPSTLNAATSFRIYTAASTTTLTGTARVHVDGSGNVGFATTSPSQIVDINDDSVRVRTSKTPASASATGTTGQIAWDSSYFYICTATDTWQRVAHATW